MRRHFSETTGPQRLMYGLAAGLTTAALPLPLAWPLRGLLGWCAGVAVYLVLAWWLAMGFDAKGTRERAQAQDEPGVVIFLILLLATLACVAAIVFMMQQSRDLSGVRRTLQIALSMAALAAFWLFIQAIFAFHYAHRYYQEEKRNQPAGGGLLFLIHLLTPATLGVRYGSKFPAKIVAWNHINGSALTVLPEINQLSELGGRTVAVPFWYSIHNILLQDMLRKEGLTAVTRSRGAPVGPKEVNLIVLAPAEMVSALAGKSIAGFIVAEPFNAVAEIAGVGKVLRFSGDVWKDHACCVTFLAERDLADKPEWAQRVTSAIVKAQLWTRDNRLKTARLLSNAGERRYTPHTPQALAKVLASTDHQDYEKSGVVRHKGWQQQRIDFQPYPYASYTEELVRSIKGTRVEGDTGFLNALDPKFVAGALVDTRFVRKAIDAVGGPQRFGLPANYARREVIAA